MSEQAYANPAALVSTQWAADHLNDANVRLLEVDVDTSAYGQGHIQGAIGINWTTQLGDPIRRDIPSKEAWEKLLSESGVSNDTRLIFYGDNNNWFAAFAYWVSKIYGHQNAALMNGGRKKWELENRPLTTDAATASRVSYSARQPDSSLRAFLRDVLDRPATVAVLTGSSLPAYNGAALDRAGEPKSSKRDGHLSVAQN